MNTVSRFPIDGLKTTMAGTVDFVPVEPFSSTGLTEGQHTFSLAATDNAVELIRRVSAGKTLVMVEHDMRVVFGLADVITVLVYGQVIASGPPQLVRANTAVQEAYLGALEAA